MADIVIEQIQFKRGTAARWLEVNPILAKGEPGYEIDTGKLKIGDGETSWDTLSYIIGSSSGTLGGTYSIEKQATAETGYLATYVLKDADGVVSGTKINIPNEFDGSGKLDVMPGDSYTGGNAYNLPYFFQTSATGDKITVTAKTVTLDGNKTHNEYSMDVPSATTTTAGLMSAADKIKVNSAITSHQDLSSYATKEWVNEQSFITEVPDSLPEGTELGEALIFNGTDWVTQSGYGLIKVPETTITWNGITTGKDTFNWDGITLCKVQSAGYLPINEDLEGKYRSYITYGDGSNGYWADENISGSTAIGYLELEIDPAHCVFIVYNDTVSIPKIEGSLTKGIWFSKQDEVNYMQTIVYGPTIQQINSQFIPKDDSKANANEVVKLTGNQVINGSKEFTSPIHFENGLSTTSYGYGGVTQGGFAQSPTKYTFPIDADNAIDGEVTVASREWVEAQGYSTESGGVTYTAGDGITISDDNVISATGGNSNISFDNKTIIKAEDDKYQTVIGGWKEISDSTTELFVDTLTTGLPTYSEDGEIGWDYNSTITSLVNSATTVQIHAKFTVLGTTFNGNITLNKQSTIPYVWKSNEITIGSANFQITVSDSYVGANQGGIALSSTTAGLDLTASTMESFALVTSTGNITYHPIDANYVPVDGETIVISSEGKLKAAGAKYVTLAGTSGELTDAQSAILSDSEAFIYLGGKRFDFTSSVLGRSGIITQYTSILDNVSSVIEITVSTKAWTSKTSTLQTALTAGSNITITNGVISASGGSSSSEPTMGRAFTTNIACGNLPSGISISATDTVADILYRILYQSTGDKKYLYYGVSASVPTNVEGLTKVETNAEDLKANGYVYKNITLDESYPFLAIDKSLGLVCYEISQSGFGLGMLSVDLGNQILYYPDTAMTDTGVRLTYKFEEA